MLGGGPPSDGGEGWCEVRRVTGLCLLESVGEYLSRRWTTLVQRNFLKRYFASGAQQHVQATMAAATSGLGDRNTVNESLIKCSRQLIY